MCPSYGHFKFCKVFQKRHVLEIHEFHSVNILNPQLKKKSTFFKLHQIIEC
jgi:hypothetical protein